MCTGKRRNRVAIEFAGSELVFPGRDGGAFSKQAFNRHLAAACRASGVEIITAHGLRHIAANVLLNERGRNIRELQELLGHRSLATTARHTHIDRERLRGVVGDLALPADEGVRGRTSRLLKSHDLIGAVSAKGTNSVDWCWDGPSCGPLSREREEGHRDVSCPRTEWVISFGAPRVEFSVRLPKPMEPACTSACSDSVWS